MIDKDNSGKIMARACPDCYVCGSVGKMLYHDLRDRIFGTPGEWNVRKCPNPECGLMWLDPMPVKEDIGKAYQNYYTHWEDTPNLRNVWLRKVYALIKEGYLAHKYGYHIESVAMWKRFFGMVAYFHPGRRADLDFAVMYLPAKPSGRLLEVGCGGGKMLKLMQNMGWCVEGVDFDRSAVENAKAKGLKVHFGTLDVQKYPENHFDAVIMSHLVEHVHHPLGLLEESHRILKPGGHLVIMTPNGESWGHGLYGADWRGLEPPRHLYVFSIKALLRLTKKAGLQNLKAWTSIRGGSWLFIGSRSIRIKGSYVVGSPQLIPILFWARCMQFAEWAILKVRHLSGEEIGLVLKK